MEELLAKLRSCSGTVNRERGYSKRRNKWTESGRLIDIYTGLDTNGQTENRRSGSERTKPATNTEKDKQM